MRLLMLWVALVPLGCMDYTVRGAAPEQSGETPDPVVDHGDDDTGDDDAGDDDTGDDDADAPDPLDPCAVPVPGHVDLQAPVWGETGVHFYVPLATWALAAAHASRQVEGLAADGLDLRLRPSYFLATALKESFMGCSDTVGPDPLHPDHTWARQAAADRDGCFQLESTTAWIELCRLYPDDIDCERTTHDDVISSAGQADTGRDNFETSALAAAWYDTFAYAMLTRHGVEDPDLWFAGAADPQAMLKTIAVVYNRGAWSTEVTSVLDHCQGADIEDCLGGEVVLDYVQAVSSYARDMEAAIDDQSCYDGETTVGDIQAYADALQPLFPDEPWDEIVADATASFLDRTGGAEAAGFQLVAGAVLDAFEDGMETHLACPDGQLQAWYGAECP